MTEETYEVVYPGGEFPKGAVRALSRGLQNPDKEQCDSYVALWIRDDGEAVFGRAWCDGNGKCRASFPFGGKEMRETDTKGFRILTYIGPNATHNYKYRWVRASKADSSKLVYCGEYLPCVVKNGEEECLGKAHWNRRLAWTSCHGKEQVCKRLLCQKCEVVCMGASTWCLPLVRPQDKAHDMRPRDEISLHQGEAFNDAFLLTKEPTKDKDSKETHKH